MPRNQDSCLSSLGTAVAQLGKAARTLHLLKYLNDEGDPRQIHIQLNRAELPAGPRAHQTSSPAELPW